MRDRALLIIVCLCCTSVARASGDPLPGAPGGSTALGAPAKFLRVDEAYRLRATLAEGRVELR